MSEIKKSDSIVGQKAYDFAILIIQIYKELSSDKREFVLSKQLLRSGISIGANINEAISSESKKDFVHKLSIALKESRETSYWLRLLSDSEYIEKDKFIIASDNCNQLIKLLNSIILTTKERYLKGALQTS